MKKVKVPYKTFFSLKEKFGRTANAFYSEDTMAMKMMPTMITNDNNKHFFFCSFAKKLDAFFSRVRALALRCYAD